MNVATKTAEFILENDIMYKPSDTLCRCDVTMSQKYSGRGLLRPARADQSEQIGLVLLVEVLKGIWNQFFVFRQPKKTLCWSRPKNRSRQCRCYRDRARDRRFFKNQRRCFDFSAGEDAKDLDAGKQTRLDADEGVVQHSGEECS